MEREPNINQNTPERHSGLDALFAHLPPIEKLNADDVEDLGSHLEISAILTLTRGESTSATEARLASYLLAVRQNAPGGLLERFARTGEGDSRMLRAEYGQLPTENLDASGALFSDLLGTHLFHRDHPETGPALPEDELAGGMVFIEQEETGRTVAAPLQLPERTSPAAFRKIADKAALLINRYGDPFRAYLRLPGVDASLSTLEERYLRTFAGGFDPAEVDVLKIHGPNGPIDYAVIEVGGVSYAFVR